MDELSFQVSFEFLPEGEVRVGTTTLDSETPSMVFESTENGDIGLRITNVNPGEAAFLLDAASRAIQEGISRGDLPEVMVEEEEA